MRVPLLAAACLMLSSCVAATVAGAAVDVTAAAVGVTAKGVGMAAKGTGAVIGAAIPDGEEERAE